jgi:hypothetical protein
MDDDIENGITQVRDGAEALCDREGPLRERLLLAATAFWAAYFFQNRWPSALKAAADELVRSLLSHGRIAETVASLTDDAVPQLASRLLEFFEKAEQALGGTDLSRWF